ncbi:MAG: D-xylose transport system substrate-binding protein [Mycobacteriales bacterium]
MLTLRRATVVAVLALVSLSTAACNNDKASNSASGGARIKIALLLPESQTTRYESFDRPLFEAKVKSLCDTCDVIYKNANSDKATQQSEAEAAISEGVKVIVFDAFDAESAGLSVDKAKLKNIPVVAYDRLISKTNLAAYISFDNEKVGKLQAQSLVDKLKADGKTSGKIVMINGDQKDNNALLFNKGAHSVLDSSGFTVVPSKDFWSEWKPANAQSFMEGQVAQLGKDGFVGVYAANDGTAGGAIAAMRAKGISPIPPITGQDAEKAAVQRILSGEQYMTIYKAIKPQAEKAAEFAVELAKGQPITTTTTVNNGSMDVPSVLLDPVAVTIKNLKDTIFADKFYTAADVCTGEFAAGCKTAGIA